MRRRGRRDKAFQQPLLRTHALRQAPMPLTGRRAFAISLQKGLGPRLPQSCHTILSDERCNKLEGDKGLFGNSTGFLFGVDTGLLVPFVDVDPPPEQRQR